MSWAIWTGGPTPDRIITNPQPITSSDGVQHPAAVWNRWSASDLMAKFSAYPFVRAMIPAGHRVVETTYALQDGSVHEIVTTAPIARTTDELKEHLSELRWKIEQGGTTWSLNGWIIETDDRSQSKYQSELMAITLGVRADGDPWKFPHGFEPVTNAQMQEIAIAARAHVLQCFAKEAELLTAITAGTITDFDQIDAADWPVNPVYQPSDPSD